MITEWPHVHLGTSAESKVLEAVQSKATALVHRLRHLNSEERRRRLGLMKLEERRERGDMIEVYTILNGQTKIDPSLFWEVRQARNRVRLVKEMAVNGRRQRPSHTGSFKDGTYYPWN